MTNRILAAILGLTLLLLPAMCVCPVHAAQTVFAEPTGGVYLEPGGGVFYEGQGSPARFMQWLLLSCLTDGDLPLGHNSIWLYEGEDGKLHARSANGSGDVKVVSTEMGGFGSDMSAATGIPSFAAGVLSIAALVDAQIPNDITINTTADATVGNLICTSVTVSKQSGVAGADILYEAETTSTLGVGWKGPANVSATRRYQHADADPTDGQVMAMGAPAAGVSAQTWITPTTAASTDAFTNKTLDSNGTGNVVKGYKYIVLTHPHMGGAGVTGPDTTATNETYGQFTFANATDVATNYVEYRAKVPPDIDTAVDLVAWFDFVLGGADTADHDYLISMHSVAASGDYTGTPANAINLTYTADGSGASGDVETAGGNTLTDWKGAVTAGSTWVFRVARDGDDVTNDDSTVDSYSSCLTIRYGFTQ